MKYSYLISLIVGIVVCLHIVQTSKAETKQIYDFSNSPCVETINGTLYINFVKFDPTTNTYRRHPDSPLPMNDFILAALEGEMFPNAKGSNEPIAYTSSFNTEALKAQAVAIRTFLLHPHNCTAYNAAIVESPVDTIAYAPNIHIDYDQTPVGFFIRDYSWYLARTVSTISDPIGTPADTVYRAYTHIDNTNSETYYYDINAASVYEPVMINVPNYCCYHGGLGQHAANNWAIGQSHYRNSAGTTIYTTYPQWTWKKILAHYYRYVNFQDFNGVVSAGDYRWNMLDVADRGVAFNTHRQVPINIEVQNTGNAVWPAGMYMQAKWLRYTWNSIGEPILDYISPAWQPGTMYSYTVVDPGANKQVTAYLKPPQEVYVNKSRYTYCVRLDFYMPAPHHKLMSSQGWETQDWCEITVSTPPPPAKPKDTPTVPPAPPCTTKNCPTPFAYQPVSWQRITHSDPIRYIWERRNAVDTVLDSGITQQPPSGDPVLNPNTEFSRGDNFFYVYAVENTDTTNVSTETTRIAHVFYDPDQPVINLTAPVWAKPGQSLNLGLNVDDTALSSGMQAYTVTGQYNTEPPVVLQLGSGAPDTTAFHTTISSTIPITALHNSRYILTIRATDYAGNTQTSTHSITIDAQAPLLFHSNHPIWTNQATVPVPWQVHDGGIGVQRVAVAYRRAGDSWTPVPAVTYAPPYPAAPTGTITLTGLRDGSSYELRYTLIDGFGNQRTELKTIKTDFTAPTASIPDISDPGDTTIFIPQAWTELLVAGNDGGNYPSGIAYYEVRYGTERMFVDGRREVRWLGSRFIGHAGGYTLRFKAPANARYVFAVRARDWAGNLSTWSAPTLPYQFSTGYGGYYDGYRELYLPLFRPTVVPFPSAPPEMQATEQRGTWTPYPLPEK